MTIKVRIRVEAYTEAPTWKTHDFLNPEVEVDDVEAVHTLIDKIEDLIESYCEKEGK